MNVLHKIWVIKLFRLLCPGAIKARSVLMCPSLQNQKKRRDEFYVQRKHCLLLLNGWRKLPVYGLQTKPQCPCQTGPYDRKLPSNGMHLLTKWNKQTYFLCYKLNLQMKNLMNMIDDIPSLASGTRPSGGDWVESWLRDKKRYKFLKERRTTFK